MHYKIRQRMMWVIALMVMIILGTGCDTGIGEAYSYHDQAMKYYESDEISKCIEALEKALEHGYEARIIYNDIGDVYISIEEYEKALEYLEKAEAIQSIDEDLCTNMGIVYYHLGRYEEALEKYTTVLEIDKRNVNGLYGSGMVHMNIGNYEQAISYFDSYLVQQPSDFDAKREVAYCYIYENKLLDAYNYINQVIKDHYDQYDAFDIKGYLMEQLDSKDNVENYYLEVREKFPDNNAAWMKVGQYYYNNEFYNEAVAALEEVYEKFPDKAESIRWLSKALSKVGDRYRAEEYAEEAIELEPEATNYNNKGSILYDQGRYLEAIPYYEEAIAKDTEQDKVYSINLMYAHIWSKRYQKVIDYGESILDTYPDSYEIPQIMAYAYSQKNDYDKSIEYFMMAKDRGILMSEINYFLAENYFYLGQYDKANEYVEICLDDNLDDYEAIDLKKAIQRMTSGSENIIRNIVKDYYLYYNSGEDQQDIEVADTSLSYKEAEILFNKLTRADDPYSFYIYGDAYDYLNTESSSISFETIDDKTILVNIHIFNADTDHIFIEYLDTIENPESKTLILNVMDNGGGHTRSAVNMLDSLLPAVTVCSLIDRKGRSIPYYTSESKIDFEHIYVFINRNSASASELLTLALDTFLDNVTIVGEQSHGKGVGQYSFENPNKKEAYFLVNHYWNVREINIMDVGVKPDIVIKNPSVERNMKAVMGKK